ncbi:16S rRNA (guanine(966)-N(2))-methyltransferase RsmD [Alkaliphilus sp. MSJ-5]|uniref:16S rRNA (Guanine(966)-N(2))-methyltransferase RsmD n=1 Tax=Alkaliphilus flagellatus TaxID=2841507 RepID=A0ABS6G5C8_9FIRM|nr:16S rRNA (guanine(966)-N(2))-methyltransferase RsmD [Alkaliphilus flagellatus]MBU5677374.1 16S rRNA (guanine(966)-N(2))-methyltransferase RsmD [Alkaliphilus flagellatus]
MRVISGKARGHALKAPQGLNTRPTADRVKESIFNIVQSKLYGSIVIDLFAGSGNLGIESLSRNASKAYFIDNNKNSIQSIRENLKKTNLGNSSIVIQMDVLSAIKKLSTQGVKANIIFLDPPYSKGFVAPTLEDIFSFEILQSDGIVVVEHNKTDEIPESVHNLQKYRTNNYGDVAVSFYELREEI